LPKRNEALNTVQNLIKPEENLKARILKPIIASLLGLLVGGLFVVFTQSTPLEAYVALIKAGFSCQLIDNCALWTTFQFATPIILSGLSAMVAFRAGIFSIGQSGQMLLGAAFATWIGARVQIVGGLHPFAALLAGVIAGSLWGLIPGLLKALLGVNEIIVTLVMNRIAMFVIGAVPMGRIPPDARLTTLAHGTKLNTGFLLAVAAVILLYFYLFRSRSGFEQRMSGQAPDFAHNAGMHPVRAIARAMLISGGLAGLAGGIEILGVHYHFVSSFSIEDNFDGIVVALLGQVHPIGIFLASIFLGGVRLGSLNGLLLEAHVPRELGSAMIAIMVLFMCADRLYRFDTFNLRQRWQALRERLSRPRPGRLPK
jgi:ABC-type uncharacterized transport system permease subunit